MKEDRRDDNRETIMTLEDEEEDLLVSQLNMDISNQFVVFSVEDEEYGVPILAVQEIISLPNLTRIPGVPEYIPGIINLRGSIIPLYELRSKFKLETRELDNSTIVIIAQTGRDNHRTVGFIVDAVSDVVSITAENLSEKPEFSKAVDARYIEKIGKIGNRMIIIINLSDFFSENEQAVLDSAVL
ncbi:chemotaxis protein CheW [Spirochaeta isovalerica]|uniref:Chemotaxis protein CheW n=1 Tax=Spirochaeta isovalerica TaxID=150 RepID=A0A841R8F2_9SPIO|nr:chemotaxis protein CheW [Spirochaeta isovalerica]MBB6480175.1 purine-binding chemotaxis protein CheW [Spirochaeta isovalerica]